MSAPGCLIYYGLRYELSDDEIDGLEDRSDKRIRAARDARLKYWWDNFNPPDEEYLLFIGAQIALIGPEDQAAAMVSAEQLQVIMAETPAKLLAAGFEGTPALHIQWRGDA